MVSLEQHPWYWRVGVVGLLLAALPYLGLCWFAVPAADDFFYAFESRDRGYWAANLFWWEVVNARWAATAVLTLHPLLLEEWMLFFYRLLPVVHLTGLVLAARYFLGSPGLPPLSSPTRWWAAMAFSLLYLHRLPTLAEGLYWFPGAITYFWPALLLLIYFRWANSFYQGVGKHKGWACALLLLLLSGFSEVGLLLAAGINGVFTFSAFRQHRHRRWWWLILSLLPILLLFVLQNTSGNLARADKYADGGLLANSVMMTGLQTGRFLLVWGVNLPLLAFIGWIMLQKTRPTKSPLPRWLWFLLLLLPIVLAVFPPYWATGILGQHRTLNLAWIVVLPLSLALTMLWPAFFARDFYRPWFNTASRVLWIAFLVGLLVTGNSLQIMSNIFGGDTAIYAAQMEDRYRQLKHTPEKEIFLPPLLARPKSLYVPDLTRENWHWINEGWARFYQVDSVALTHPYPAEKRSEVPIFDVFKK
ncbi:MAG: DUF6056 family protein [Salibacteraceae bacterium]